MAFPTFSEGLNGVIKKYFSDASPLDPLISLYPSLLTKIFVAIYSEAKFLFTFIIRLDKKHDVIIMARSRDKVTW